jgi:hypothetical protein
MALQFESNMQNLVYQMDVGAGRKIIQSFLFALFAFSLAALTTFSNFQGLKDARAMEEAQLARNLAMHGRLTTQCIRPLSMWCVAARSSAGNAWVQAHPDLLHPPVWPALLAGAFRLGGGAPKTGVPTTDLVYRGDYLPVAVNHLFTALSALWVWLIGRKLFDRRVGALSAGAFLISNLVWQQSLSGADLSAAMFFSLGAVYAALWTVELPAGVGPQQAQGPVWRWLVPLAVASLLTAAAFLTRYAAGSVALLVFVFIGVSRRRRPWAKACLYIALAALLAAPWMVRNLSLSGNPFGLVFHEMLADTYLFPGDALARSIHPEMPDAGAALYAVQIKMAANLRAFFSSGFGFGGAGILLGLFAAMFFHRFVRPSSRNLRWCILSAAAVQVLFAAAFGEESLRALALFWPLAIPYGWAFFLVLLDRLQFEVRFFAAAAISAVMFLTGLPLLLNVLPPRTGMPYPPYFHRYIGWVSTLVSPGECIVTDIPWAMAWYGGQTSILLPKDIDGFYDIDGKHQKIALAYFTTVTRDKPWIRGLSDPTAPEYSWYQVFAAGKVPGNFPLTHGRFIAGSDQLLLADRPRW